MQSILFSSVDLTNAEFIESNLMNAMFNETLGIPTSFARSVLIRCDIKGIIRSFYILNL